MTIRAIDVSRWQGPIDWHAVRGAGVQAAWIKVGGADGGLYRDSRAATNLQGAPAAGVEFGTYYFCSPARGNAVEQARHAVTCGHGAGKLWPAADVESNPHHLSRSDYDRWVTGFCNEVRRLTGRESLVYTYSAAGLVGYTANAPSHCRLWIANYASNRPSVTPPAGYRPGLPPAWSQWDVWQFNSTTRVPGIPGNTVDQNVVTNAFWSHMTGPTPSTSQHMEDDDMYHVITDARDKSPMYMQTWVVHGFTRWLCPDGFYAGLFQGGDPAYFVNHGWQGDGTVWAGLLDASIAR